MWITGVEIAGFDQLSNSLFERTTRVGGDAEAHQHSSGLWEQAMPFLKDLRSGKIRAMQKEFRAPSEEIRLARIHFSGALVFAGSFDKPPFILEGVCEQSVKLSTILAREECVNDLICACEVQTLLTG